MCLVALALDAVPRFPLLLAANRDERHTRPTHGAAWWPDLPDLFGGRDLQGNGSWLALSRAGRLAAVTNFRDPLARPAARSRGELVAEFVSGSATLDEFAAALGPRAAAYGPFNLLLYADGELRYLSNRAPAAALGRGVHALSNTALGDHWPKTRTAHRILEGLLGHPEPLEPLFDLLARRADPKTAPEERYRSAHFIVGETYGTRCSTVLMLAADGTLTFVERSFDAASRPSGEVRETLRWPARKPASHARERV